MTSVENDILGRDGLLGLAPTGLGSNALASLSVNAPEPFPVK